ncbi:MAG: 50S ribosomal protein L22 [Tenuifilum sp.]|jgi:large subunit ribosomal protein L22|uniref:50S ribosomal protein L22 n=1 Tax=Tenuifilum sp. TaxID=2760880 RepID=UPI0019869399|nr:50S ribosomal protein L22 [Bacteroidales bacterium]HOK61017.1 50S ribosomal protein L22 [Tenuifilum sp.]MBP7169279.1 50S ribosomal protein L22 [Bacteroidales bacterium]MBP9028748.1 50S ribosomal protein L22 [Bacteroidales bacterium]HOK85679.1 50S ribosomal protein L22 [Tenuifilum sp.]
MGARKHNMAERLKAERKNKAVARLRNCPSSPRKMRLVVDLVRGKDVNTALNILKFSRKDAAKDVHKLILSAVANWKAKNENVRIEDANLYIKEIFVDQGRMLKRIRTAPQGRAHRIRKRSNHVTVVVDSAVNNESNN